MSRGDAGSLGSKPPTVLGADGQIDLAGGLGTTPPRVEPPPVAPGHGLGDAWVADRARRTLPPPSVADVEIAAEAIAEPSRRDSMQEMADRFALGDYASALSIAELQLGRDSSDEAARHYAAESRKRLEARYTTRIGSLDYVFNCVVPAYKVKWLGLDPQAAFLLSLVDGQTSVDEVLALCPMGRLEALRVFAELLDAEAIVRVA